MLLQKKCKSFKSPTLDEGNRKESYAAATRDVLSVKVPTRQLCF
jgi:hypothetical protein